MTKVDVGGAMLSGAFAKWQGRDTLDDNPYADRPGMYVLHKAWRHGFEHHEEVIEDHNANDFPPDVRPRATA